METDRIKKLIDRYFEGRTTVGEEREIYAYFSSGKADGELNEYRDMFLDMASADMDFASNKVRKPKFAINVSSVWRRVSVSVAAVVAVAFGTVFAINSIEEKKLANLYEGSYVITNGKRVDNLMEIKGTIGATLADAAKIEHNTANMQSIDDIENEVLQNVKDPQQKKLMEQMLNN